MIDHFLFQVFIYLVAAVVSVPIAKRLGLGSVLGYLIAGVIIGPFVLKLVGQDTEDVMHFAEFGVVLMLFLIGLELRPALLWRLKKQILGVGSSQVVLTTAIIFAIAYFVGLQWKESLAIGLILALSSTAIVLQTLSEKGLLKTQAGRNSFSVLLFQDISLIPILAFLPLLAIAAVESHSGGGHDGYGTNYVEKLESWQLVLLILFIVSFIIVGGRFLSRPVFKFIAGTNLREIFIAFALFLIVGITLAMQFVGLSPALGTFLAGVVLADSEYRHAIETDIEPFKGLLLGLFFISIGASINFNLLFNNAELIALLLFGLIVIKFFVLLFVGKIFKFNNSENFLFSFALAQGGEFAFVLFSFASQNNVVSVENTQVLILVVALSMLLTPLMFIINEKFVQKSLNRKKDDDEEVEIEENNPVIIAGFGRFGQIVGRFLHAHEIGTTVLDHDASQIDLVRRFGYKVYYGDSSSPDLLRAAGAEEAKLFVVAIDDKEKANETVKTIKKHFPHLKIMARAFDRSHTYELLHEGVDNVRRETFDSALQLGIDALVSMGYPKYQASRDALTFKHHDEQTLSELAEHWGDEKKYILHSNERNKNLLQILREDEKGIDDSSDHSWERPFDPEE